jgi:hypothetical protein
MMAPFSNLLHKNIRRMIISLVIKAETALPHHTLFISAAYHQEDSFLFKPQISSLQECSFHHYRETHCYLYPKHNPLQKRVH